MLESKSLNLANSKFSHSFVVENQLLRQSRKLYDAKESELLKWFVSPLKNLHGKPFKSFHVRHEASPLELVFDLFFVANLATFTAYHRMSEKGDVGAYIGLYVHLSLRHLKQLMETDTFQFSHSMVNVVPDHDL